MGALSLEGRVTALEQAIANLQGSEALNPNYLTVTPQGLVGADFTGVINAQGLVLPAATSITPAPVSEVAWKRASDGGLIATLFAYSIAGASQLDITADLASDSVANLELGTQSVDGQSSIELAQSAGTMLAQVTAGAKIATLLDNSGNSSFLKLATEADVAVSYGQTSENWNNSSPSSPTFTITHGLGRAPTAVLAVSTTGVGIAYTTQAYTSTTFEAFGYYAPGTGLNQTVAIAWIAIG
jgi:hypothetical protein